MTAGATPQPVTLWRLEWLRMTRSARGLTLVAVYEFFGLAGPLLAKYLARDPRRAKALAHLNRCMQLAATLAADAAFADLAAS